MIIWVELLFPWYMFETRVHLKKYIFTNQKLHVYTVLNCGHGCIIYWKVCDSNLVIQFHKKIDNNSNDVVHC